MAERPKRRTFLEACAALNIADEAYVDNLDTVDNEEEDRVQDNASDGGDISVEEESNSESSSDDNSDDEIENNQLLAPNGIQYSVEPYEARVRNRNIINQRPRAIINTNLPKEAFLLFLTEEMILLIQTHTNLKRQQLLPDAQGDTINRDPFSYEEILAALAIIIRAGSDRDNFCSLSDLWRKDDSRPFYRATMSYHRFKFFLRCVRFDNYRTRDERREYDKLAAIREIWDLFLPTLRQFYVPREDLTVDEQLVGYRGRVPGRTYMPSKPRKYGIKVFWICESSSGFALNGFIYTGRQPEQPIHHNLGPDIVLQLCEPFFGSGRNIVTDNFFTTHTLATDLLQHRLTLLGTVRVHRRDVPPYIRNVAGRPVHDSRFVFDHDNKIQIVSYVPKKNKNVVLLSSSHSGNQVIDDDLRKPELILDYNKSKGGVDTMDENVEEFTCRRKTVRWPLLMFYNIIDITTNNAYILFNRNGKKIGKKAFLKQLAFQLAQPYAETRLQRPGLHNHIKEAARQVGYTVPGNNINAANDNSLRRCFRCSKPTRSKCGTCMQPICPQHRHLAKITKCGNCR